MKEGNQTCEKEKNLRLDKFLCEMNIGTRSQVKKLVKQGAVSVNGCIADKVDIAIDERRDEVSFQGKRLHFEAFHYYMLNKPKDTVSATTDLNAVTVLELLPKEFRKGIFPVGRLDKDTEGLLLLTDDGALAHDLLSPKKHVDKVYEVVLECALSQDEIERLEKGVDIGEKSNTLPAKVKVIDNRKILLTIHEGKFHQVKRMLHAVGNGVRELKRLSFGSLWLDENLLSGAYRKLTPQEVEQLQALRSGNVSK